LISSLYFPYLLCGILNRNKRNTGDWLFNVAVICFRFMLPYCDYHHYSLLFICQFLDGRDADSVEVGKFCGDSVPPPFLSTGNVLRVEFRSDFSSSGQGFLFQWAATTDQILSTTPAPGSTTPSMKWWDLNLLSHLNKDKSIYWSCTSNRLKMEDFLWFLHYLVPLWDKTWHICSFTLALSKHIFCFIIPTLKMSFLHRWRRVE
jgi:hypothetical protein